jgi:hypothetical protein
LVLLAATPALRAQQHDTRGTDFWVTFMSNDGTADGESDLRLFISAEKPTTVRVVYFGAADTMVVPVPQANTAVAVDISGRFGSDAELGLYEERSAKSFEVIADDEITLYGVNIRSRSADAFVSLPDDVLTNRYIVLAYPNGWSDFGGGTGEYDMPSQFAIVGTEDGTTVRITPSARLNFRNDSTFTIALDRGEVFNGQATIGEYQDVSGTEIRSNKPVAVFAGNRRASVPLRVGNFRDHLVEQMPPLEVWGKEAVVTPHYPITPSSTDTAVVRVLAAFDNTRWQIDGVDQTPLQHAASVEIPLTRAMFITASDPILVAQYEHSSRYDFASEPQPGDPFMMLVPPTEQFFNEYVFQSVDDPEFLDTAHFVNIVIPTSSISSLVLDGRPVVASWTPVPKPGYSYTQLRLAPGSHKISADSSFGIYAYGFGVASSYGYPGGMLFRSLVHDFEPPDIAQTIACDRLEGIAFDSRITDSGIDSLYVLPASRNVNVTIDPFVPGADTVAYRARLADPYQDGVVSVKAIDSAGRSRTQTNPIPGFTVRALGMLGGAPVVFDSLRLFTSTDTCVRITLENVGMFPQTIPSIVVRPAAADAGTTPAPPITIPPGGSVPVTLCVRAFADTAAAVTVAIANGCIERPVAVLPIVAGIDSLPPEISTRDVSCDRHVYLTIADTRGRSSQIASVTFDTLVNARVVSQSPANDGFPASEASIELAPIDEFYDLVYAVRVIDRAGNLAIYRDTIGGFTITALDAARDSVSMRFGRDLPLEGFVPGGERCDSVELFNYGARALRVASVRLEGNRLFSVPSAQLPLIIPPHGSVRLLVCIEARALGLITDTLVLSDGCGREDRVALKAPVAGLATADRCNSALTVTTVGAAKRTFLSTPHPNPSRGAVATIDVGLGADASVTLELVDATGRPAGTVLRSIELPAGLHRVTFDVSTLDDGVYFCRLRASSRGARGEDLVEKLVVRR